MATTAADTRGWGRCGSCLDYDVSLFRRLPLTRQPPPLGDLSGRHTGCNKVAPLDRVSNRDVRCAWGCGCNGEPHMSANKVLRHAVAVGVYQAEAELRLAVPLIGGLAVPDEGLRVVLRHAVAIDVHH